MSLTPAARCAWCGVAIATDDGRRYCSKKCRQTAFRLRKRFGPSEIRGRQTGPGRFIYADPPYVGLSHRYYRGEPTYAGEVDHVQLIASLMLAKPAGWALSASVQSLRELLPLCPREVRVNAWVKPIGVPPNVWGTRSTWECVIVWGGRPCRPGIRDWLRAMPARGGDSDLIGRKPLAFCAWLFDLLGMREGDELVDLFPGSGAVTRAWGELSAVARPRATA